jgi:hypothetical protein
MKKNNKISSIDWNQFQYLIQSSIIGGRKRPLTKSSRKDDLNTTTVSVIDKTTSLEEKIVIPTGHYTKKELTKLKEEALNKLAKILISKRK